MHLHHRVQFQLHAAAGRAQPARHVLLLHELLRGRRRLRVLSGAGDQGQVVRGDRTHVRRPAGPSEQVARRPSQAQGRRLDHDAGPVSGPHQ